MNVIQALIAYFERRGRLTSKQLYQLLKPGLLLGWSPRASSLRTSAADLGERG
jgi:hypothetical protein